MIKSFSKKVLISFSRVIDIGICIYLIKLNRYDAANRSRSIHEAALIAKIRNDRHILTLARHLNQHSLMKLRIRYALR